MYPKPLSALTCNDLLEALKIRIGNDIKDLIMPTAVQAKGEEQQFRAAEIYKMRLPDSKSAKKKAPYVLIQVVKTEDIQKPGDEPSALAYVRIILCVYSDDESEGALMLLNLAERIRISFLKNPLMGENGEFWLDVNDNPLEFLAYPDDTAPYYPGEFFGVWHIPSVEREVPEVWGENLKHPYPW